MAHQLKAAQERANKAETSRMEMIVTLTEKTTLLTEVRAKLSEYQSQTERQVSELTHREYNTRNSLY